MSEEPETVTPVYSEPTPLPVRRVQRNVLAQDQPQFQESVWRENFRQDLEYNKKEEERYQKDFVIYEKEVAKAEEKYQKDLEKWQADTVTYEKELAQYEKDLKAYNTQMRMWEYEFGDIWREQEEKKGKEKVINEKYDKEEAALDAEMEARLQKLREKKWSDGPIKTSDKFHAAVIKTRQKYKEKKALVKDEKHKKLDFLDYKYAYPDRQMSRTLLDTYKNYHGNKSYVTIQASLDRNAADKANYNKYIGRQNAISDAIKARESYGKNPITFSSTITNFSGQSPSAPMPPAFTTRANAVKPTAMPQGTMFNKPPQQAVKNRPTLINVKTGEYIPKQHWMPNNPGALVASIGKPMPETGTKIKQQPIKNIATGIFIAGIGTVQYPSKGIVALSEFQQQYKSTTKPSQSVLEGVVLDSGGKIGFRERQVIDKLKNKPADVISFTRTAKYTNPKTGESFDASTGVGSVRIGQQLGFQFDQNMQRPDSVMGEAPIIAPVGSLEFVVKTGQVQPDPKKILVVNPEFSKQAQGPAKPRPLESAIQFLGEQGKKYKDIQPVAFTVGALEEGLGFVGSTINLIEQGKQKLGEYAPVKYPIKQTFKPYALPSSPMEYPFDIAVPTILEGQPIGQSEKLARQKQIDIAKREGGYRYSGKLAVALATTIPFGGVAKAGTIALSKVGIAGQTSKMLLEDSEKLTTVYKGITFRDRPMLGIQEGKIQRGIDYSKIPYEKINIKHPIYARSGIEASVGSGIEKFTYYSRPALEVQVKKGVINPLSAERAQEVVKGTEMGLKVPSKPSSFAPIPFENLSKTQSNYLFEYAAKLQRERKIESVHGSVALGAQVPAPIKPLIKFGDIDLVPTVATVPEANKIIQNIANKFPLEPNQSLRVEKPAGETTNRKMFLRTGQKEEKILEVVLNKGDDALASGESVISKGNKILGHKIPFSKSVKEPSTGLKVHTANYQLLTNVKQVLAYQPGKSGAKMDIYTSSGRTKDIARTYLNLKAKAIFAGGKKGEALDIQAEKIRSLYKIDYGDIKPEKIELSSTPAKIPNQINPLRPVLPREEKLEPKIKKNIESKLEGKTSQSIKSPESSIYRIKKTSNMSQSRINIVKRESMYSRIQSSYGKYPTTSKSSSKYPTTSNMQVSKFSSVKVTPPSRLPMSRNPSYYPPRQFIKLTEPPKHPPSKTPTIRTPPSKTPPPSRIPPSITGRPPVFTFRLGPPRVPPFLKDEKKRVPKSVLKKQKEKADFLGNVSETNISGIFKRSETVYGQKKINRLLSGDVRVASGKPRNVSRSKKKKDMFGFGSKTKFF